MMQIDKLVFMLFSSIKPQCSLCIDSQDSNLLWRDVMVSPGQYSLDQLFVRSCNDVFRAQQFYHFRQSWIFFSFIPVMLTIVWAGILAGITTHDPLTELIR